MNVWLDKLKRYGRWLALVPLLMAITVTIPKLYLELVASDIFGTRTVLPAEIIGISPTPSDPWDPESCRINLRIGARTQNSPVSCAKVHTLAIGDTIEQVDAWTVFLEPEEAGLHAVIDLSLLLLMIAAIVFCLNIPGFVNWIERQTQQSAPIFKGHSQRKENI